jgi:hypothetical protein
MDLFVEFFTLYCVVKAWNHSSVSLLLSLILKSIKENMITMILWFLNIRLNHDYGDVRVVDILAVDTYSRVEVCMPIFLGEASKIFFG